MTATAFKPAWIVVPGIAIIATGFRFAGLGEWTLWLDESWSRWMATSDWEELRAQAAAYDTHPPAYYSALKLWLAIAPETPWGMRLLSALAGVLTVAAAWACARQVPRLREPAWVPPFAAALVAASLPMILAARQARPYALWALALTAALWAALALLRPRDAASRTPWRLWIAYAAALEAVLWLHSLGILFAGALGGGFALALVANGRARRDAWPFLGAHLAAGLAFLPGLAAILEHRRNWTSTWLVFDLADVPGGLASGLALPGIMAIPLFALAAIGAASMLARRHDRPAALLLLFAALGPAAAAVSISMLSSSVFLERTLVPSVVPLILLVAAGAGTAGHKRVGQATAASCLGLSCLVSAAVLKQQPVEPWGRVASMLDARVGPSEEVWLIPNELTLPLGYAAGAGRRYALRGVPADFPAPAHGGPRPSGSRAIPGIDDADAARMVSDARARGVKGVWLVSRFPSLFDPADAVRAWLGPRGRTTGNRLGWLVVEHYPVSRASASAM